MKYSFVFVACVASLMLQCSARPQGVAAPDIPVPVVSDETSSTTAASTVSSSSTPAAETIMTDAEAPTEVTNTGEQVIFDEAPTSSGSSQDDSESAGVTTDMPARSAEEMQLEDAATTITPEMVEEMVETVNLRTSDDAPAAPTSSSDDEAEAGTTQAPEAATSS